MMRLREALVLLNQQPEGTFLVFTDTVMLKKGGGWISHEKIHTIAYYTDMVTSRIRNPENVWSFS